MFGRMFGRMFGCDAFTHRSAGHLAFLSVWSEQAANKASSKAGLPPSPAKSAAEWQAVGATASPTAVKARRRKKSQVHPSGRVRGSLLPVGLYATCLDSSGLCRCA